ncbi:hypothetical protein NM688_g8103 [Phlebia brevispora]|uniref:Uncharacterized protein n=1 Tax=Phlebia brevispora TaxID=194682 RepID=A0ACC1RX97_9APHY|nr:hypothetical protein NM688_g8103 [Phlebia brevispora]
MEWTGPFAQSASSLRLSPAPGISTEGCFRRLQCAMYMSSRASDAAIIDRRRPEEFGPLEGLSLYDTFENRQQLSQLYIHPPREAGLYGTRDGVTSIVMSGSYEDDEDHGVDVIYTGCGGRDRKGNQIGDQSFGQYLNGGLRLNSYSGNLVRLFRGSGLLSPYAPVHGLRYDGLYEVLEADYKKGRSEKRICSFKLKRAQEDLPPIPTRGWAMIATPIHLHYLKGVHLGSNLSNYMSPFPMSRDTATISRRQPIDFGPLLGLNIYDTFVDRYISLQSRWKYIDQRASHRLELSHLNIHPPPEGGMYGNIEGVRSIILSGGYEDDQDFGETVIYTGHGGRDSSGKQVQDQKFEDALNAGLRSPYAPEKGYRYDGLYEVHTATLKIGKSGKKICSYELKRIPNNFPPIPVRTETAVITSTDVLEP